MSKNLTSYVNTFNSSEHKHQPFQVGGFSINQMDGILYEHDDVRMSAMVIKEIFIMLMVVTKL